MQAAGLGAIVDRDRHRDDERHGLGQDEQPGQAARFPRFAATRDDISVCIAVGHLIIAGG